MRFISFDVADVGVMVAVKVLSVKVVVEIVVAVVVEDIVLLGGVAAGNREYEVVKQLTQHGDLRAQMTQHRACTSENVDRPRQMSM